jgi:hypothetical protein
MLSSFFSVIVAQLLVLMGALRIKSNLVIAVGSFFIVAIYLLNFKYPILQDTEIYLNYMETNLAYSNLFYQFLAFVGSGTAWDHFTLAFIIAVTLYLGGVRTAPQCASLLLDRLFVGYILNTLRSNFVFAVLYFSYGKVLKKSSFGIPEFLILGICLNMHLAATLLFIILTFLSYGVFRSGLYHLLYSITLLCVFLFIVKSFLELSTLSENFLIYTVLDGISLDEVFFRGISRTFIIQPSLLLQISILMIVPILLCEKKKFIKNNLDCCIACMGVVFFLFYPEVIGLERLLFLYAIWINGKLSLKSNIILTFFKVPLFIYWGV